MKKLKLLALSTLGMLFLSVMCIASFVFGYVVSNSNAEYVSKTQSSNSWTAPDPYKLFELVNLYRKEHGIPMLRFNPDMCEFSKVRLSEVHTDWSHNGWLNAKKYYKYVFYGENLVQGYSDPNEAVNAWLKSPKHLENIVNPHYTDTCVVSDVDTNNIYAVQHFASF